MVCVVVGKRHVRIKMLHAALSEGRHGLSSSAQRAACVRVACQTDSPERTFTMS